MKNETNFIGKWVDKTARILEIRRSEDGMVADVLQGEKLEPVERKMLGKETAISKDMKAYMDDANLVVELGIEGLGATLQLEYKQDGGKEFLIPTIINGLYDDMEDDFGVPWIFPLSVYRRV